jgi:hypothetical protein
MNDSDHRNRRRHQVLTPIYFMVTKNGEALTDSQHHIEGEIIDLSETGFRMRSSHNLEEGEEVSFDISSEGKNLFRGVAKIMHCLPEMVYGARYIKIKKN